MGPNDFQNNPHTSPKKEKNRTKKIIPFERKEKRDPIKSDLLSEAQIIVFPDRYAKVNSPEKRQSPFELEPAKSGGLFGLMIIILILALLFAL